MDFPFAFSEFTEEDIEGSRSAIGRFGRTERKNDTLKRFLGKPLLNFLSEDGYTMRRVQAASSWCPLKYAARKKPTKASKACCAFIPCKSRCDSGLN